MAMISQIVEHDPAAGKRRVPESRFEPDIDRLVLLEEKPGELNWPITEQKEVVV